VRTDGSLLAPVAEPQRDGWWWRVWRAGAISVLIVGDDTSWREEIAALLEAEGYAVRLDDGSGDLTDPTHPFDIAVVDLGLTTRSARAVCATLRARSTVPILAVAPGSVREPAVLDAYAAGADQCVSPTVRSRELLARVRALLRRHPPHPRRIIDLGEDGEGAISLDPSTGTAVVAGRPVSLTTQESAVLHALLWRPGRVATREELMSLCARGCPDRVLDSLVRQVRTKLEAVEGQRRIVAVRGVGFRFLPANELTG
jgi:DNA-binding response OmpR family regulator